MPDDPARGDHLHGELGGEVDDWGRDEQELVRRCREGSDAAYAALVRLHRPRLFTLAYRLTGDRATAEDVVQEVFLAAFKGIDRYEPKPSLAPWLNTIAVRIASRTTTRESKAGRTSLDRPTRDGDGEGFGTLGGMLVDVDPAADPSVAAEAAELRRDLSDAIAALPFKYRAAVVLRYVLGLDYAGAAVAMDVPLNTFKSHLLRGTRMLRNALSDHLDRAPVAPSGTDAPGGGSGGKASASSRPSSTELPYAAVASEGLPRV